MKIKKPYTISESEKERIRGLHNNVKNLLREDSSEDESYHYGKDMGHDDKELYDLKHDGGGHIHIDDLEDDIHYDDDHDWGVHEKELEEDSPAPVGELNDGECGGPGQCSCKDVETLKKQMGRGEVHELFKAWDEQGGCCYCAGVFQLCPCPEPDSWDDILEEAEEGGCCACPTDHKDFPGCTHDCCEAIRDDAAMRRDGGRGKKRDVSTELGETSLPTGWTMKTLEEINEEGTMDDLYEVWSGHEDDQALRESMRDDGTIKESIYQLPARFGNKRLTESQLIHMIKTIIK